MSTSFGQMHFNMIDIPAQYTEPLDPDDPPVLVRPAQSYPQLVDASGTPWKEVGSVQPTGAGIWFIAADPATGMIYSADNDPLMLGTIDHEYWSIDNPGPAADIIGKIWTGTEVVDPPLTPAA